MDVGTTLSQVDAVNESTPKMGCTDDVEDFEPVCDKPREINALEALRKRRLKLSGQSLSKVWHGHTLKCPWLRRSSHRKRFCDSRGEAKQRGFDEDAGGERSLAAAVWP